jgi:hypothetical protein
MYKKLVLLGLVVAFSLAASGACAADEIWREAESADKIAPPMKIYPDEVSDPVNAAGGQGEPSGGKYIGTDGKVKGNNDLIYAEGAKFNITVKGGTYKIVARVSNVQDDSFWMRIPTATTNTKNNSNGWVSWNGIRPQTADWHWVEVHSSDDNKQVVQFTLSAGTHTVEWLHRENENFLDGFVVTDNLQLDPATLLDVVRAVPLEKASKPCPANRKQNVPCKVVLGWTPGKYAPAKDGHRIYFSEDVKDVNQGLAAALQKDSVEGTPQDSNKYPTTGTLDLGFGKTYYWRVDEANSATGWDKGNIWQFTVEPLNKELTSAQIKAATAVSKDSNDVGPEKTIDRSGLDANDAHSTKLTDMWLSKSHSQGQGWIKYEFDKPYKLHKMLVWNYNGTGTSTGCGFKNVTIEYSTSGSDWTQLGSYEFAIASGGPNYVPNTTIDFAGKDAQFVRVTANSNHSNGALDKYGLSEVRFFYIPELVR